MLWKTHNKLLWYIISFLTNLMFIMPIWVFFFTDHLGLTYGQASTIWVIGLVTAMIFEVPSGTWADRWGKKRMLISGGVIMFLTSCTFIWTKNLYILILSQLMMGVWMAMKSWCLTPLVYDRYQENWSTEIFSEYTRVSNMMSFLWRAVATVVWWYLYFIDPFYPLYAFLGATLVLIAFFTLLYEPPVINSVYAEPKNIWTIDYMVEWRKQLRLADWWQVLKLILLFMGAFFFANMLRFTYQPLFESWWFSSLYIWYAYAIGSLLSLFGAWSVKYIPTIKTPQSFLTLFLVVVSLVWWLLFLLNWLDWFWLWLVLCLMQFSFWWRLAVMEDYINQAVRSEERSTINSMMSFSTSFQVFFAGIVVWYVYPSFWFSWVFMSLLLWWLVLLAIDRLFWNLNKKNAD